MNEDKASRYHRLTRRVRLASAAACVAGLVVLLAGGSHALRDSAMALSGAGAAAPSTAAVYSILLAAVWQAARLPLSGYQTLVLERRYGLVSGTAGVWLRDYLKGAAVFVLLAAAAAEVVYLAMAVFPAWWWLVSAGVFGAALAALARLAPLVLIPLFYRLQPLERPALRSRLAALCARARVPAPRAYVWGLGEKTRRANALLVGTGPTRRILLSDTLLADYSDDEIEVVLAHEIAHHVHGDIRRALAFDALLVLGSLALGAAALRASAPALGLAGQADVAGLPVLLAAALGVSVLAAPPLHALSRRSERRADRYALALTERPEAFISALRRLGAQNLAEERPSRTARLLFHSHPTVEERIESAKAWISGR